MSDDRLDRLEQRIAVLERLVRQLAASSTGFSPAPGADRPGVTRPAGETGVTTARSAARVVDAPVADTQVAGSLPLPEFGEEAPAAQPPLGVGIPQAPPSDSPSPPAPPSIPAPEPTITRPAGHGTSSLTGAPSPTPAATPLPPRRAPSGLDSERWIGQRVFLGIGVIALLLAAGYLLKLSFERGWISPVMRCLGGIAAGLGVGALGWRLEPRYRTLAVSSALGAASALLLARARVLSRAEAEPEGDEEARFSQVSEEVRLAHALQVARDLVYPSVRRAGGSRQVALIARIAELREIVLTSRLDLDLLGHDHAARFVRARLGLGLRKLGGALAALARSDYEPGTLESERAPLDLPDLMEAAPLLEGDPRGRLLPVVAARLRYLSEEVDAIRGLLAGRTEHVSLRPEALDPFVSDHDTWPARAVFEQLSLDSPVFRHAFRCALAMTSVYFLARALPWATRPYWMLLSVAVVLRGTFDDTLTRRNARVLGTALGCVTVAVLVPLVAAPWLELVFVGAVGIAHAFVNVRYLLTAAAGTVMALLQAHFAAPTMTPLIIERLLDTVIGALFAWGFSYVLPSWERRSLPGALDRAVAALCAYSKLALVPGSAPRSEQRLARQRAYDALAVVAAAMQRSAAEPRHVRPPVKLLVTTLEHSQRLMAHLSSLRALIERRGIDLPQEETHAALRAASETIEAKLSLARAPSEEAAGERNPLAPPEASADENPLPWLVRRLDASIDDAAAAGIAAREALSALARPVPPLHAERLGLRG